MNKFRRKAKKSLLGALSLLSAFSSVAPMSAMNKKNGEDSITVDYDDDDLSGYDTEAEEEDVPELKKPGLSTAAKIGIGVGAGGAAALGIGLLASYLSKSDGEIGKKITIEDIDLQNRYNNGAIDGFDVGDKIDSATMKQEFPSSQSKIKGGFLYEYLGGKEFKVIDIYLNNGESHVYLGADIKNSPTLKNMNESNGNPIDSKAHYKVTRTGSNYNIAKSDTPNLNSPVAPVVPVQNLSNQQPVMPPQLPPADNLPILYTLEDARALASSNTLFGYDIEGVDGVEFLYEIDSNRKFNRAALNVDVFSGGNLNTHNTYYYTRTVNGKMLLDTLDRFPNKCKLYGQHHEIASGFNYTVEFKYDRETKGIQIRPRLARGQIISASEARGLGFINEEPQPNVFFVIDDNHVPQVSNDIAVAGNRLFEDNKDRLNLNPGIIYRIDNDGNFVSYDINKEYLRSNKDNLFTIEELSRCSSLKECLIPGTSMKFKDLNILQYQAGNDNDVYFGNFDCVITNLDNPSVRLVSSAPLNVFTGLNDDSLNKFKIYENSDSPAPLTIQQLRNVQGNRRVRQDQRTGKLYLTQMPGVLSRAEDNILHPSVPRLPLTIRDEVPVPGVFDGAPVGSYNVLGRNIRNHNHILGSTSWSLNKYLNYLIDNPTARPHPIGAIGAASYTPVQNFVKSHNLSDQVFKDIFGDLLMSSVGRGGRYVRRRLVRGRNRDLGIYILYEIIGRSNGANHVLRYASLLVQIGNKDAYGGPDDIGHEPRFMKSDNAPDLQNIPPDNWCLVPY